MKIRIRSWCPWGLLILLVFADPARAWLPVPPDELQMTSEPRAPKAAAIYLYRQVDRDDISAEEIIYARIKVLTEEGRKFGNVEIPYQQGFENIRGLQARTIAPDGSTAEFNGTVYDKQLVKRGDYAMMAKSFTLPNVQVGSVVEYRYQHNLAYGWVFNSRWVLSQDLFTRHAVFSLKPSREFTLRWSWPLGLPQGTQPPKLDHGMVFFETRNVPAFVTEDLMPPEELMKFRVEFIYESRENSQAEPEKYWKAIGTRVQSRLSKFLGGARDLEDEAGTIVLPADSPETKVRKIYARVQQMRNLSFERERTQQEAARDKLNEIDTAREAWKRGYGGGTDLTWLFLALVRAVHIDAHALLISTRDQYFFQPAQMNARQLNSNAVVVKLPDRELFLDPGTPFTPFGLLPWEATAVMAFRLDENGGTWITTPSPRPEDSRVARKLVAQLSPEGTLKGRLTVTYTGLEAAVRRMHLRLDDAAERRKFLEKDVEADVPTGIRVSLTNSPDWSGSESPLVAELDFSADGWAALAGTRALLPVGLFGGGEKHIFEHGARVHPMYFPFPCVETDDVAVELPPGWQVASTPQPLIVDISGAKYSTSATTTGTGSLTLKRELMLNFVFVEAKYYPPVHDFFQKIRAGDDDQVVLGH